MNTLPAAGDIEKPVCFISGGVATCGQLALHIEKLESERGGVAIYCLHMGYQHVDNRSR